MHAEKSWGRVTRQASTRNHLPAAMDPDLGGVPIPHVEPEARVASRGLPRPASNLDSPYGSRTPLVCTDLLPNLVELHAVR